MGRRAGGGGGQSPWNGDFEDVAEVDGSGGEQQLMGSAPEVELIASGAAGEALVGVPLRIHQGKRTSRICPCALWSILVDFSLSSLFERRSREQKW